MKKLLSVVLALLMLAVMLPVVAMADDANYCTIEGVNGKFDTLTAAAKAWRESKGVVTEGNTFGANNLGTVESIVWDIYGTVPVGDGAGVAGDNGAGECIFTGGYFTPAVTVSKVTVTGHNNATISKTNDKYRVSVNANEVVFANITFEDTMRNDSNPGSLTFTNCTFKADLRMPHNRENATLKVENCTFTGEVASDYAIFVQGPNGGTMSNVVLSGNNISGYRCGVNVQAGTGATVSITGNTITNLTGYTKNDQTYGAAIQLTTGREFIITNNKIDVNTGNAFRFYSGLDADVTISDNIIKAPYLVWNQAELPNEKITSQDNKLTITNPNKAATSDGALEDATVIKAAPTQIVIITPAGDTPKTEPEKNPSTGANDMVAAAAALMAVSTLGMAVLSHKK
mgnify:CR=1 FL=1